jgi:16S rRNA (cytosine1402-N4)-methyltransferase
MAAADKRKPAIHVPIQVRTILELLALRDGDLALDLTVGYGGHAERMLEAAGSNRVLGIDRDREILALNAQRNARFADRLELHHGNFEDFERFLGPRTFSAALLDLGVSSLQLDRRERGFSFQADGPLDMRMDESSRTTAADLLRRADPRELFQIIRGIGDEPAAKRIVDAIVAARRAAPPRTTFELRDLIAGAVRVRSEDALTRTLSRVFMALRIVVNDELGMLERTLPRLIERILPGGRIVVASFHSGEDRVVKRCFADAAKAGLVRLLTPRPIEADPDEIRVNPRARSSKVRAVERIEFAGRSSEARRPGSREP